MRENENKRRSKIPVAVWIAIIGLLGTIVTVVGDPIIIARIQETTEQRYINQTATAAAQTETFIAQIPSTTNTPTTPSPTNTPTSTATFTLIPPTPTATFTPIPPTPTPTSLPSQITDAFNHKMMLVPAGEFLMGIEAGDSDEYPVHTVYVDDYYIDQYEVTNHEYAKFLNDMGNQSEGGVTWLDATDAHARIHQNGGILQADSGYADHPVIEVSWYGGKAYCEWRGARLPTEAEWEKAARGSNGRIYPWGDQFDSSLANVDDEITLDNVRVRCGVNGCDGYERTSPVGSFPAGASPYGVLDLAGNVFEWVQDWYEESYYSRSPYSNPQGPNSGFYKVMRGGSWWSEEKYMHSSNRSFSPQNETANNIGFRCVYSP